MSCELLVGTNGSNTKETLQYVPVLRKVFLSGKQPYNVLGTAWMLLGMVALLFGTARLIGVARLTYLLVLGTANRGGETDVFASARHG